MKSYKSRIFLKGSALLILLALLLPSNSYAEKKSFEFCTKLSQSINKEYPMRINKYAVVQTSLCFDRRQSITIFMGGMRMTMYVLKDAGL